MKQLLTDEQILSKSCDMQRSGDPEPYMEAWEVEDWVMEVRDIYEKELQKERELNTSLWREKNDQRDSAYSLREELDAATKELQKKDEEIERLKNNS